MITVIIVNYNAGQFLVECIASILTQVRQIIIVDNASDDNSLALCEQQFPQEAKLTIIRNAENLGFATACNIGIKQAKTKQLLFLNPDCRLETNTIKQLSQILDSDNKIGMVGALLLNADGSEQGGGRRAIPTPWRSLVRAFGFYRFAKYWPKLFFDFHLHQQPLPKKPIEVEAISGACMLVKSEAITEVGLWDEGYFLHCEDLDWCLRFWQKGWKILFVPDAKVTHALGVCSKSRPIFVEWHKHKGMMRFYRKFFRQQYSWGLMGWVAVGVWLRFSLIAIYYSLRLSK